MTKKQDEIISLLEDIKRDLEEQSLRLDEIENAMFEISESARRERRTIMKALNIKRKKKSKTKEKNIPDIDPEEWPIVEIEGVIQESDQ